MVVDGVLASGIGVHVPVPHLEIHGLHRVHEISLVLILRGEMGLRKSSLQLLGDLGEQVGLLCVDRVW